MPQRGHFVLYDAAVPPLKAGEYVLEGDQSIPEEPDARFEGYRGHIRVTSPRFSLPPDHVLSTWPPANSEGAYESRLPQIVLRRRTLPWERDAGAADLSDDILDDLTVSPDAVPWLALVVIAEGEGELSGQKPVEECITPGRTLTGPNDVATGVHLTVPRSVVRKVFPTVADLPLLAHVREVDIDDTELAMGDDDGFLAVIMANRLPQYDRAECRPVRYLACLVNLESQLDLLPEPSDPILDFLATAEVFDAAVLARDTGMTLDPDLAVMGTGLAPEDVRVILDDRGPRAPSDTTTGGASAFRAGLQSGGAKGAPRIDTTAQWRVRSDSIESAALSAEGTEAGRLVRDAMKSGFRYPIEVLAREPTYRFPVLAHWSFTCTGAGSFETLMQGLDVGLLGTTAAPVSETVRPDCVPESDVEGPPPPPPSRPEAELAETGHVGLPHLTRRGEPLRAWYRGPLTPHVMVRDRPDEDGRLPMAHTSDQLRRLVPDGREDLSSAAAFEIGRLLALSHPAIIAALMRWRREQFGAARARRLAEIAIGPAELLRPALDGALTADLGRLLGRELVLAAARDPAGVLAPSRPPADPGRPLEFLGGRDLDQVLAAGFGIPVATIRELRGTGDAGVLDRVDVPGMSGSPTLDRTVLEGALTERVQRLAADALSVRTPGGGGIRRTATTPGRDPARDALDEILVRAARGSGREEER